MGEDEKDEGKTGERTPPPSYESLELETINLGKEKKEVGEGEEKKDEENKEKDEEKKEPEEPPVGLIELVSIRNL